METEHNGHLPVNSQVTEQHGTSAASAAVPGAMATAALSEDMDPSELKDKDTEKEQKSMDKSSGSKTKEAKERENKKRERSPKSLEGGDKATVSPQKITDPAKAKERDERIRVAKERRDAEQKKKKDELQEQAKKKQDLLRKQEEDRKRKIREMKRREEEHRVAIEDRRKRLLDDEMAKRDALVKKYQSRDSKLEQMRNRRSMGSYAFGSSTPRMNFEGIDVSKRSASQSCLSSHASTKTPDEPDGGGQGTSASGLHASRRSASSLSLVRRHTDKTAMANTTLSTIPSNNRTGPGTSGLPARPASAAASYKRLSMSTSHLSPPHKRPVSAKPHSTRRSVATTGSVSNLHSKNIPTAGSKRAKSSYSDLTQSSDGSPIRRSRPQSVGRLPNYASPTVSSKLQGRAGRGDQTDGEAHQGVCYRFRSQSAPPVEKRAKSSDGRQSRTEVQATFDRLATPKASPRESSANQRTGSATPPKAQVNKSVTGKPPKSLPTPPKAVVARSLVKDQKPPRVQSAKKEVTPVKGPVKAIHKPPPTTQPEKKSARTTKQPVPVQTSQDKISKDKRSTNSSRERPKAPPSADKKAPPPSADKKAPPPSADKKAPLPSADKKAPHPSADRKALPSSADRKAPPPTDHKAPPPIRKTKAVKDKTLLPHTPTKTKSEEKIDAEKEVQNITGNIEGLKEEVKEVPQQDVSVGVSSGDAVVVDKGVASSTIEEKVEVVSEEITDQPEKVPDTTCKVEKVEEKKTEMVKEQAKPPAKSAESTPSKKADSSKASEAPKMSTEEQAKVKLAEKRREARERAQREAEEKKRQDEEARRLEEERIRREEEEQRRFEEEQIRLGQEARKAEEERLRLAIEEEERRKAADDARIEAERIAKEEADKKAAEEAKRKQKEAEEKARKEEEERLERKKRLEMIMKRVKQDDTTSPKSETSSPVRTPKAERSPSPPAVDVATELRDREDSDQDEDSNDVMEGPASPPPERDLPQEATGMVTPVKALTEEAGPKFKSPLLQQMLGKGRLKLSKENLAEKSSESSNGDSSASSKSSPDKEERDIIDHVPEVSMVTSHMTTKTMTRTVTTLGEDGKETTVVKTTETSDVSGEDLAGLDFNELSNKVNGNEFTGEETLFKDAVMGDNSELLIGDSGGMDSSDSQKLSREDLLGDTVSTSVESKQTLVDQTTFGSAATGASADLLDLENSHVADDTSAVGNTQLLPNGGGLSSGLSESDSQELNGDVEMRENGQFSPVEHEDNHLDQLIDLNQVDNKMTEPASEKFSDLLNSNVENEQVLSKTPLIAFENNTTSNHTTDNTQECSEPKVVSKDQISQLPSHADAREGNVEIFETQSKEGPIEDLSGESYFREEDKTVSKEEVHVNAFVVRTTLSSELPEDLEYCAQLPVDDSEIERAGSERDKTRPDHEETLLEEETLTDTSSSTKDLLEVSDYTKSIYQTDDIAEIKTNECNYLQNSEESPMDEIKKQDVVIIGAATETAEDKVELNKTTSAVDVSYSEPVKGVVDSVSSSVILDQVEDLGPYSDATGLSVEVEQGEKCKGDKKNTESLTVSVVLNQEMVNMDVTQRGETLKDASDILEQEDVESTTKQLDINSKSTASPELDNEDVDATEKLESLPDLVPTPRNNNTAYTCETQSKDFVEGMDEKSDESEEYPPQVDVNETDTVTMELNSEIDLESSTSTQLEHNVLEGTSSAESVVIKLTKCDSLVQPDVDEETTEVQNLEDTQINRDELMLDSDIQQQDTTVVDEGHGQRIEEDVYLTEKELNHDIQSDLDATESQISEDVEMNRDEFMVDDDIRQQDTIVVDGGYDQITENEIHDDMQSELEATEGQISKNVEMNMDELIVKSDIQQQDTTVLEEGYDKITEYEIHDYMQSELEEPKGQISKNVEMNVDELIFDSDIQQQDTTVLEEGYDQITEEEIHHDMQSELKATEGQISNIVQKNMEELMVDAGFEKKVTSVFSEVHSQSTTEEIHHDMQSELETIECQISKDVEMNMDELIVDSDIQQQDTTVLEKGYDKITEDEIHHDMQNELEATEGQISNIVQNKMEELMVDTGIEKQGSPVFSEVHSQSTTEEIHYDMQSELETIECQILTDVQMNTEELMVDTAIIQQDTTVVDESFDRITEDEIHHDVQSELETTESQFSREVQIDAEELMIDIEDTELFTDNDKNNGAIVTKSEVQEHFMKTGDDQMLDSVNVQDVTTECVVSNFVDREPVGISVMDCGDKQSSDITAILENKQFSEKVHILSEFNEPADRQVLVAVKSEESRNALKEEMNIPSEFNEQTDEQVLVAVESEESRNALKEEVNIPSEFDEQSDEQVLVAVEGEESRNALHEEESFMDENVCDNVQYEAGAIKGEVYPDIEISKATNEKADEGEAVPCVKYEDSTPSDISLKDTAVNESEDDETSAVDADEKINSESSEQFVPCQYTSSRAFSEVEGVECPDELENGNGEQLGSVYVSEGDDKKQVPYLEEYDNKESFNEEHISDKLKSESVLSTETGELDAEITCSSGFYKRRHTSPVVVLNEDRSSKINVGFLRYSLDHDSEGQDIHDKTSEETIETFRSLEAENMLESEKIMANIQLPSEEQTIATEEDHTDRHAIATEANNTDDKPKVKEDYNNMNEVVQGNSCFAEVEDEQNWRSDFSAGQSNSKSVLDEATQEECFAYDDLSESTQQRSSLNEVASSILDEVFNQVFVACAETSQRTEEDEESQQSDGSYIDLRGMKESMVTDHYDEGESGTSETDDSEEEACMTGRRQELVQKLEVVMEETCDIPDMTELPSSDYTDSSSEVQTVVKDESPTVETILRESDSNSESVNEIKISLISSGESEEDVRRFEPQEDDVKAYDVKESHKKSLTEAVQYSSAERCLNREGSSLSSSESEDSNSGMEYCTNNEDYTVEGKIGQLSEVVEINDDLSTSDAEVQASDELKHPGSSETKTHTNGNHSREDTITADEENEVDDKVLYQNATQLSESVNQEERISADLNENETSDSLDTNDNQCEEVSSAVKRSHTAAIDNKRELQDAGLDSDTEDNQPFKSTTQMFGASLDVEVGSIEDSSDDEEGEGNDSDCVTAGQDLTQFDVVVRKKGNDSALDQHDQI